MTMGTASTMTALGEALGMTLPGASSIPAADSNHVRLAMDMRPPHRRNGVGGSRSPRDILTPAAFRNAITVDMAIGGSTNAIIHLVAHGAPAAASICRLRASMRSPLACPCSPTFVPPASILMEDFFYAGGLRALMAEIPDLLDLDCMTVNGKTIGENIEGAAVLNRNVIRERSKPLMETGGTVILFGSLAPDGAVIKWVAADRRLWQHTGPAVVFHGFDDMEARINRDDLDVDENSVLVLQNAGPLGGPGMPEWGMLPIPKKILKRGIRDMVRISDSRMSGTAYGTCVLHVSPESYRRRSARAGAGWRHDHARHPQSQA